MIQTVAAHINVQSDPEMRSTFDSSSADVHTSAPSVAGVGAAVGAQPDGVPLRAPRRGGRHPGWPLQGLIRV